MLTRTICGAVTWAVVLAGAPAWADFRLERQIPLPPGGAFILETDAGSVAVTGDSASGAFVTLTSRLDDFNDRYDVQFEDRAGVALVRVKKRVAWMPDLFRWGWRGSGDVRFTIRVPRSTMLSVSTSGGSVQVSGLTGNARVRTSGGSLRAENIQGNVDLRTSGGSITARSVRGDVATDTSGGGITVGDIQGNVRADTSGGRVEIDSVSGEVYARTSGGRVQVRGAGGRVEAHSSGGPVTVGFAAGNGRGGVLSTSGGAVRAEIDPAVALSVDASTSGGGVNSDLPVAVRGSISRNALRGDLNGGGPLLRLRSSGGGIRIVAASR